MRVLSVHCRPCARALAPRHCELNLRFDLDCGAAQFGKSPGQGNYRLHAYLGGGAAGSSTDRAPRRHCSERCSPRRLTDQGFSLYWLPAV
jgi:hypothetical protein